MKLMLFTTVWKRPEITEICFMSMNRLSKVADVQKFAAISEESMIPLCEKHGVKWVLTPNHPLGAKKNVGVKAALKYDWDYLIEVGSDDLLKSLPYKWDSLVMGLMDFAIVNTRNGDAKRLTTNIPKYGAGRAYQRWVIENVKLWEDSRLKGMDNSSTTMLLKHGIMAHGVKTNIPAVVGLKSDVNLWSFKSIPGKRYPLDEALSGLSEEEITAIKCLAQENISAGLTGG